MGVNQYILIGTNFHGQPRFGRNEFKHDGCATDSGNDDDGMVFTWL
jgi:hypothetical protein